MNRSRTDKLSRNQRNTSNTLTFTGKKPGKSTQKSSSTGSNNIDAVTDIDIPALTESMRQLTEVDAARVVALHDRIQRGNYYLDNAKVAEKLLNFESQLASKLSSDS
ncbi:MAG: flagellar biosynthesis anti-sigma factor FlgM [Pseudohongiellaceae bacterium]